MYICKPLFISTSNAGVPKKNVIAVEDFLQAILVIYVVSATGKVLGICPEDIMKGDNWERPVISVNSLACTIVAEVTKLRQLVSPGTQQLQDVVLEHTTTLLTLVLLWFHYRDVSREGDGDRFLQITHFQVNPTQELCRRNSNNPAPVPLSDARWDPDTTAVLSFCKYACSKRMEYTM